MPPDTAESCDPNLCICTSHENYRTILASRLAEYEKYEEDTEIKVKEETQEKPLDDLEGEESDLKEEMDEG